MNHKFIFCHFTSVLRRHASFAKKKTLFNNMFAPACESFSVVHFMISIWFDIFRYLFFLLLHRNSLFCYGQSFEFDNLWKVQSLIFFWKINRYFHTRYWDTWNGMRKIRFPFCIALQYVLHNIPWQKKKMDLLINRFETLDIINSRLWMKLHTL